MKKTTRTARKVLSVFLAVLMMLTTWAVAVPGLVLAADGYAVDVYMYIYDGANDDGYGKPYTVVDDPASEFYGKPDDYKWYDGTWSNSAGYNGNINMAGITLFYNDENGEKKYKAVDLAADLVEATTTLGNKFTSMDKLNLENFEIDATYKVPKVYTFENVGFPTEVFWINDENNAINGETGFGIYKIVYREMSSGKAQTLWTGLSGSESYKECYYGSITPSGLITPWDDCPTEDKTDYYDFYKDYTTSAVGTWLDPFREEDFNQFPVNNYTSGGVSVAVTLAQPGATTNVDYVDVSNENVYYVNFLNHSTQKATVTSLDSSYILSGYSENFTIEPGKSASFAIDKTQLTGINDAGNGGYYGLSFEYTLEGVYESDGTTLAKFSQPAAIATWEDREDNKQSNTFNIHSSGGSMAWDTEINLNAAFQTDIGIIETVPESLVSGTSSASFVNNYYLEIDDTITNWKQTGFRLYAVKTNYYEVRFQLNGEGTMSIGGNILNEDASIGMADLATSYTSSTDAVSNEANISYAKIDQACNPKWASQEGHAGGTLWEADDDAYFRFCGNIFRADPKSEELNSYINFSQMTFIEDGADKQSGTFSGTINVYAFDKTDLRNYVYNVGGLGADWAPISGRYSDAEWNAYKTAYTNAVQILGDQKTNQKAVTDAYNALVSACEAIKNADNLKTQVAQVTYTKRATDYVSDATATTKKYLLMPIGTETVVPAYDAYKHTDLGESEVAKQSHETKNYTLDDTIINPIDYRYWKINFAGVTEAVDKADEILNTSLENYSSDYYEKLQGARFDVSLLDDDADTWTPTHQSDVDVPLAKLNELLANPEYADNLSGLKVKFLKETEDAVVDSVDINATYTGTDEHKIHTFTPGGFDTVRMQLSAGQLPITVISVVADKAYIGASNTASSASYKTETVIDANGSKDLYIVAPSDFTQGGNITYTITYKVSDGEGGYLIGADGKTTEFVTTAYLNVNEAERVRHGLHEGTDNDESKRILSLWYYLESDKGYIRTEKAGSASKFLDDMKVTLENESVADDYRTFDFADACNHDADSNGQCEGANRFYSDAHVATYSYYVDTSEVSTWQDAGFRARFEENYLSFWDNGVNLKYLRLAADDAYINGIAGADKTFSVSFVPAASGTQTTKTYTSAGTATVNDVAVDTSIKLFDKQNGYGVPYENAYANFTGEIPTGINADGTNPAKLMFSPKLNMSNTAGEDSSYMTTHIWLTTYDKTELRESVAVAEQKGYINSYYTPASFRDYEAALANAREVLGKAETCQDEIDAAKLSLENAEDNLVLADCDAGYHQYIEGELVRPTQNTDGTWNSGYKPVYCEICGEPNGQIDVPRADYTAFDAAVEKLNELDELENITDEAKEAIDNVIAKAEAFPKDRVSYEQSEVDAIVRELTVSIKAIEDYNKEHKLPEHVTEATSGIQVKFLKADDVIPVESVQLGANGGFETVRMRLTNNNADLPITVTSVVADKAYIGATDAADSDIYNTATEIAVGGSADLYIVAPADFKTAGNITYTITYTVDGLKNADNTAVTATTKAYLYVKGAAYNPYHYLHEETASVFIWQKALMAIDYYLEADYGDFTKNNPTGATAFEDVEMSVKESGAWVNSAYDYATKCYNTDKCTGEVGCTQKSDAHIATYNYFVDTSLVKTWEDAGFRARFDETTASQYDYVNLRYLRLATNGVYLNGISGDDKTFTVTITPSASGSAGQSMEFKSTGALTVQNIVEPNNDIHLFGAKERNVATENTVYATFSGEIPTGVNADGKAPAKFMFAPKLRMFDGGGADEGSYMTTHIWLTSYDKAALREAVNAAEQAGYNSAYYNPDKYVAYENALANAKEVLGKAETNQNEVDAAEETLKTAIENLKKADAEAKFVLTVTHSIHESDRNSKVIDNTNKDYYLVNNGGSVTPALNTVITELETVNKYDAVVTLTVTADAAHTYNYWYIDYSGVQGAINAADEIINDTTNGYSGEYKQKAKDAKNDLQDILNGKDATTTPVSQGDVDNAIKAVTDLTGHDHVDGAVVVENNVEPKCEDPGSYDNVTYCTECGKELSRETVTVPASGHDYDIANAVRIARPTQNTDGTWNEDGKYEATCRKDASHKKELTGVKRADYTAFDAAVAEIKALAQYEGFTDTVKNAILAYAEKLEKGEIIPLNYVADYTYEGVKIEGEQALLNARVNELTKEGGVIDQIEASKKDPANLKPNSTAAEEAVKNAEALEEALNGELPEDVKTDIDNLRTELDNILSEIKADDNATEEEYQDDLDAIEKSANEILKDYATCKENGHQFGDAVIAYPAYDEASDKWSQGTYTYTCGVCDYVKVETYDRASYEAYNKALADLNQLLADETITDAAKADITKIIANNTVADNLMTPDQSKVDAAAKALKAEVDKINNDTTGAYEKVNYTKYDAAVEAYDELDDIMSAEDKQAVEAIKAEIAKIPADGSKKDYQAQVDKAATDIAAINAKYSNCATGNHTWEAKGEFTADKSVAPYAGYYTYECKKCEATTVIRVEAADYSQLDELVEELKDIINDNPNLTVEAKKAIQDAIDKAEALPDDLTKEATDATTGITTPDGQGQINALVEELTGVKTTVEGNITDGSAVYVDLGAYNSALEIYNTKTAELVSVEEKAAAQTAIDSVAGITATSTKANGNQDKINAATAVLEELNRKYADCAKGDHKWGEAKLTQKPTKNDDGTWNNGTYTYTCDVCGATKTEAAVRADYTEFDKALADLEKYLENDQLTESVKEQIESVVDGIKNGDYVYDYDQDGENDMRLDYVEAEQDKVSKITEFINNQLIAGIEKGIENGNFVKPNFDAYDAEVKTYKEVTSTVKVSAEDVAAVADAMAIVDAIKVNPDATAKDSDATIAAQTAIIKGINEKYAKCAAGNHDWADATCTEPQTCKLCGATTGKANGHDWGNPVLTTAPTKEQPGEYTYTCEACGDTMTVKVKLADYSKLEEAVSKLEEIKENNPDLTEDTITSIDEAIQKAEDLPDNLPADVKDDEGNVVIPGKQDEIDTLVTELEQLVTDTNDGILDGTDVKPDFTEWFEALGDYNALDLTDVKQSAIDSANELIDEVDGIYADPNATYNEYQETVNTDTAALKDIIAGINDGSLKNPDYTEAYNAIGNAEGMGELLTEAEKETLEDLKNQLEALEANDATNFRDHQDDIDAIRDAANDIYEKYEGCNIGDHDWLAWVLTEKPGVATPGKYTRTCDICGVTEFRYVGREDYTDYDAAVERAETMLAGGKYTSEANALIQAALTEAKTLDQNLPADLYEQNGDLLLDNSNDVTIKAATDKLNAVLDSITNDTTGAYEKVDFTNYNSAVNAYENLKDKMTDADKAAVAEAMETVTDANITENTSKADGQDILDEAAKKIADINAKYADCADGHAWGKPELTKKPTATQQGEYTEICDNCGATQITKVHLADYEKFDEAVKALEELAKTENLTDEAKQAIENALADAEALDKNLPADVTTVDGKEIKGGQDTINALVTELENVVADTNAAIGDGSALKPNYNAWEEVEGKYDALDETNVKDEIIAEANALKADIAKKQADDTLTQATATQKDIDDAAARLNEIIAGIEDGSLIKPADYSGIEEDLEEAKDKAESEYVPDDVMDKIEEIEDKLNEIKEDPTTNANDQGEIDALEKELEDIIKEMDEILDAKPDLGGYDASHDKYEKLVEQYGDKIKDSVTEDVADLDEIVEDIRADENATVADDQKTVDDATARLNEIIAGIENGTLRDPDYAEVKKDLKEAKEKAENNDDVIDSIKVAIENIENAIDAMEKDDSTNATAQPVIDALEDQLEEIIAGIEDGSALKPNYEAWNEAERKYDALDKTNVKDEIIAEADALKTDIAAKQADDTLTQATATQKDIDDAAARLNQIITGINDGSLIKPADYSGIEEDLEEAKDKAESEYVPDDVMDKIEKIEDKLNEIRKDPTTNANDQGKIDNLEKELEDIIKEMDEILDAKPDLGGYDASHDKYEKLVEQYGDKIKDSATEDVADLDEIVEGIRTDENATVADDQKTVDDAKSDLDAIIEGIENGTLRDPDYSGVEEDLTDAKDKAEKNDVIDGVKDDIKEIEDKLNKIEKDPTTNANDQDEIDALEKELEDIIAGIEDGSLVKPDYTEAEEAIDKAEGDIDNGGKLSDEDQKALDDLKDKLDEIKNDPTSNKKDDQDAVDEIKNKVQEIVDKYSECSKGNHNYTSKVVVPTCTEKGYTVHTCTRCEKTYKDTYVDANGHVEAILEAKDPTCSAEGLTEGKKCAVCQEILVAQKKIEKLPHTDADEDGVCDVCGRDGLYDGCVCLCHNNHWFWHIVYLILRLIWKIFKIHPVCGCGRIHY